MAKSFRNRLERIRENGTLVLDFSLVSKINVSFIDPFLLTILADIYRGKYGNRFLIGANVKDSLIRLFQTHMEKPLEKNGMSYLVFGVTREPQWLGISEQVEYKALKLLYELENVTADQVAMNLNLPTSETELLLRKLLKRMAIKTGVTESGQTFYSPLIQKASLESMSTSIAELLRMKISEYKAIEHGGHYLLPSGVHAEEFIHLSKLIIEPRFVARLGRYIAASFKGVQVVLTPRTQNNIVLGQEVAAAYGTGTAVIYANRSDELNTLRLALKKDYDIRGKQTLLLSDVSATGYVMNLLFQLAVREGAVVVGGCCVVDVGAAKPSFPFKSSTLLDLPLRIYPREQCPLCKASVPIVQPSILPARL